MSNVGPPALTRPRRAPRDGRRRSRPWRRPRSRPRARRSSWPRRSSRPSRRRRSRRPGSVGRPCAPNPPVPWRGPRAPPRRAPPGAGPHGWRRSPGSRPPSRTAASDARATSRLAGYGRPWLIRVDSSATTGRRSASARRDIRGDEEAIGKHRRKPTQFRPVSRDAAGATCGHRDSAAATLPGWSAARSLPRTSDGRSSSRNIDLSRDGTVAVVSRRSVRGNRYVRHLWAVPLGRGVRRGTRRLTSGSVKDGWPRLSPDGRRVAFIRGYPSGRHPEVVIGLVSVDRRSGPRAPGWRSWRDRESRVVAGRDPSRLHGRGRPTPIPRRRRPVRSRDKASAKADDAPTARRITRTDWRLDESGHLDRWSHLFVIEARPGARARRVTAGDWGVSDLAWSPDGRTVAFTSDRGTEPDLHPRTTIWAVDVDAKAPRPREVLAPAGWATNPAWSPDGRWLAAIGILEPDTLDDVSPGLLVGPSRGSAAPHAIAPDLDRPIGNWTTRTSTAGSSTAGPGRTGWVATGSWRP